ncbi:MAG: cbb3-type cytochrome c oxidase subunit 3 [Hyphomicrobium sp.]|jgi:cytochrome c oxidase cbb3-type subunit 4
MTHETAVLLSQITSLVLFGSMFVGVIVYVMWPANRQRFEEASRLPLDATHNDTPTGV